VSTTRENPAKDALLFLLDQAGKHNRDLKKQTDEFAAAIKGPEAEDAKAADEPEDPGGDDPRNRRGRR
jgi:hypothetical protein